MKTPSIKKLSLVLENPCEAKRIFQMSRTELSQNPIGEKRISECYNMPTWRDIRMHVLAANCAGIFCVESCEAVNGEYAYYLNSGEVYTPTIIFWRGNYRVQSLGDFIETLERNGSKFK